MPGPSLVDRLAAHETLGRAPREELEWLASHGTQRFYKQGQVVGSKGEPVTDLYVFLTGHLAIFIDRGGGRRKTFEWRAGDVGGLLPYSRLVNPPGDSIALEPTEVLVVPGSDFPEMIRECHETTAILVHKMLDRSRLFTSNDLQMERMVSLGKLSAGLAHELNNPASAIERGASVLEHRMDEAEQAARILGASNLTDAQLSAIDQVRSSCMATRARGVLSPIQQAEREDAIADWLRAQGVDDAVAGSLAETGVTLEALTQVARTVSGPHLGAVLRWVAADCSAREIVSEILTAASRISGLVAAVKGFTHMDQATVAEPVDVRLGLTNTIAVLNAKARSKSVAVLVDAEPDLPRARGFVGELNQIWANLIDNALDAVPESGRVDVTAKQERQRVVVRVVDNGPGIPDEIREHLFEPFFTTKAVGKGTGLGLDIVRRLVVHNDADIDVESAPGRTEFRVSLPLADDGRAGS